MSLEALSNERERAFRRFSKMKDKKPSEISGAGEETSEFFEEKSENI